MRPFASPLRDPLGSRPAHLYRQRATSERRARARRRGALPPYERPALSKEYLAGTKAEDELLLRAPSSWAEREIELRLGQRVVEVDPLQRRARTAGGEELGWDVLVLATGARSRLLPFPVPEGVHTLRTVVDARKLGRALAPGGHLVVVGGAFVGAEVASTTLALGVQVTMLEALATPFERTLGPALGRLLADRYRSYGIDLRVRTGAAGFRRRTGRRRALGPAHRRLLNNSELTTSDCVVHPYVGLPVAAARSARNEAAASNDRRRRQEARSSASGPRSSCSTFTYLTRTVSQLRPDAGLSGRQCSYTVILLS